MKILSVLCKMLSWRYYLVSPSVKRRFWILKFDWSRAVTWHLGHAPLSSNHRSGHAYLVMPRPYCHAHFRVKVRVRVRARVRVRVRVKVRVSCLVTSKSRLYAIQSQPRPRLISGDWFQEPRPHYCYCYIIVIVSSCWRRHSLTLRSRCVFTCRWLATVAVSKHSPRWVLLRLYVAQRWDSNAWIRYRWWALNEMLCVQSTLMTSLTTLLQDFAADVAWNWKSCNLARHGDCMTL